jgi:hypothetical protein
MKFLDWLMLSGVLLMATALILQVYINNNSERMIKILRRDNAKLMEVK